jgi:exosome complex component RRP43
MTTHIPPSAMPLISPPALLRAYLNQNPPSRPSTRTPLQPRPIELNTSSLTHTNGSSLIRTGATTIICGIRAEILPVRDIPSYRVTKPTPTPPTSTDSDSDANPAILAGTTTDSELALYNLLIPNLTLSTGCSPTHLSNTPPSTEAQSLSQRLLSLLLTSRLIRLSDLEIFHTPPEEDSSPQPSLKAYWVLYIDLLCISHAGTGSVFDASWLAMWAALKDTLLPRAYWDADEDMIHCSPEISEARRLRLRGCPVPISFGVFNTSMQDGTGTGTDAAGDTEKATPQVLIDLDATEEDSLSEKGCVVVDLTYATSSDPTILRIEKWGGGNLSSEMLRSVVSVACERWREWQVVLGGG